VARTLGAEDFGLLYLLTSVGAFAYVFVDWGHGAYVTGEIAKRPERSGELLGTVLLVRVATAVLACLLAVLLMVVLGYDRRTILLSVFTIAAWLPLYLGLSYAWVFRGRERMDYDALLQVVSKFSLVVVSLAGLALGGRLVALVGVYAAAGAVTLLVAVILYRRIHLPALAFSWPTARELVSGGVPILAIALAVGVQPYITANLLYKLVPGDLVGWYGAAWALAGTLVAPATILGATMYPRLARVADNPLEFGRVLRTAFRPLLLVAALGGVGAVLFADFAIGVVYSEQKFGPAADILRSFAPALLLIYVDMLLGNAIVALGKAGGLAKAKILAVVVTTGAALILVPFFQARFGNGGIGIMVGIALGELIMVAAATLLMRGMVHRAMVTDLGRALLAGVATIGLFQVLPPLPAFVGIPLCVVSFAGFATAAGLIGRSDFDLLASIVRRSDRSPYARSDKTVPAEGR
jgi:O-antigen/teichoic acid export membrane protein